ncbi:MAG: peptide/nickel transport system substrate-binding protein [Rhodospirillaceae bacterium]|nr:peptide/nickel transport system substrate-binding protein [Rhodospirillaceae bacterium]
MSPDREHSYLRKLREQYAERKIDRREFLRIATLLGMSASAAYAFAGKVGGGSVAPVSSAQAADMPRGGTLQLAMKVEDISHPALIDSNEKNNLLRQACEYITITTQDNITRPYLAERWQVSEDLRTWTFYLRKNVKWRNGRAFTADDAIWNIKHVLDPATGSSVVGLMKGYMLNDVTKDGKETVELWDANAIEKVDDHTFRLNCKIPQVAVPEHFFHYPFLMLDPEEGGKFQVGSNGTGPFELVELERRKRAVFKARKDYWGTGPYLDTLRFLDVGDDPAAVVGAISSGQVDGMYLAYDVQLKALKAIPRLRMYQALTAETVVCRGKCTTKPFDDPRVRKALRLAIDQETMLQIALGGSGRIAEHHHVSPIHPEYAKLPPTPRDPAAAKKLLSDAGYPQGIDLEFTVSNDRPYYPILAQAMVRQWADVGIRVKIKVIPAAMYWDVWNKVPMGLTPWFHRPLGIMALGLAYRTGAPWNESSYSNPEFDRLLDKAEGILDVEKRREIMTEVEKIMQEDGPIVQPFWLTLYTFLDKRVKGFRMHPTSYIFGNELAVEA